jgi:hypothetical protein
MDEEIVGALISLSISDDMKEIEDCARALVEMRLETEKNEREY